MAADLLKHMKLEKLILNTLIKMITCKLYNSKITINLIFISQSIYDWLMHCQVVSELDKISDYKLIKTVFYSSIKKKETLKHKAWKKMCAKSIITKSETLWIPQHLYLVIEINHYANYLMQFIERLVNRTVLWTKEKSKIESW